MSCSLAINHQPGLSQETADEIREVADRIGYVPSLSARGLKNGKSGIVLILTKRLDNAAIEPVIVAVQRVKKACLTVITDDLNRSMNDLQAYKPEAAVAFGFEDAPSGVIVAGRRSADSIAVDIFSALV